MRKSLITTALCAIALLLSFAAPANAQATRTWISGVGTDANPCSRTAPCRTWAGAYAQTAVGGEIDALDPGGFGALTITKSITLDGGGGQVASTLVNATNGIAVAAGPNDVVTIRNVRLQGLQNFGSGGLAGIAFQSGAALNIENCTIDGFTGYGVDFEPNATSRLLISGTTITNNGSVVSGGGVLDKPTTVNGTSYVFITDTVITDGGIGVQINGAGGGSPNYVTIGHSKIAENQLQGILETTSSSGIKLMLHDDDLVNNGTSGNGEGLRVVGGAAVAFLGRSFISGNVSPGVVTAGGGTVNSYGDSQNDMNGGASSATGPGTHY